VAGGDLAVAPPRARSARPLGGRGGVLASGARQVLFGLAAAGLTFAIGRLIGVSLAG
jgi:hypothetical protein